MVSCGNSVLQIRYSMDHAAEICMGVPGRRLDIRMAQQLLNNPNIGTCFPGQGGEGVPLRYNYDKPEKPRISRVFGYLARFFILFQTEKSSREVVIS